MSLRDSETILCGSCGLCCTGALYSFAVLEPDEIEAARRLGMAVVDEPDRQPRFLQPCPCYAESTCTIYAERPRVCRNYRCRVLQELRDEDVTLEEALSATAEARRLAAAVKASLEPGQALHQGRKLLHEASTPPLARLQLLAFARFIDQRFRRLSESPWTEDKPLICATGDKD